MAIDEDWMRIAIDEARRATLEGEIPIASVLVGDGKEVTRSQTQVRRRGTVLAHGETCALWDLGSRIWGLPRPLTVYTNVEPCVMCLGAMLQAEVVDRVVYGMKAAPDGGVRFVGAMIAEGLRVPEIVGGVLEMETVELFRSFPTEHPKSPALDYVRALLAPYDA